MKQSFGQSWESLITSGDLTLFEGLARLILALISSVYGAAAGLRNWGYSERIFSVRKAGAPVISIGNLTLGGTGKTQIVIWSAGKLKAAGKRVVILSRGYGRLKSTQEVKVVSDESGVAANVEESGDEPLLMAKQLPGVPVIVGSDRAMTAQLAVERFSPHAILLDDGFQHRGLERDLDVACLDERMLEAPKIFPAGYLRERIDSVARAQFVLIKTKDEELYRMQFAKVFGFFPQAPSAAFTYRSESLVDHISGSLVQASALAKRPVYAFSGIANPRDFERMLKEAGADMMAFDVFPDHHPFSHSELERMVRSARERNGLLVTTEKDRMRIPKGVPVWSVQVGLRWLRGEEEFLSRVLSTAA